MGIRTTVDANEAVAHAAYLASEVIAIYPITPSSAMGEHADVWAAELRPNLWGCVPEIVEMQSEAGAAGALHGAALRGALATSFTASQGLLLMLPNMYKIAGELTPAVLHVAARAVATHALSIFGDHSDVMAVRTAGWTQLCAGSVQEAADLAVIAHALSPRTSLPVLHFFDGFRTSHEVATIELPDPDDIAAMLDADALARHRRRGLDPTRPQVRGTAQNPDVFFQAREASNPWHAAVPATLATLFDRWAARTGRRYGLVDYHGHPDADRVIVMMGSGAGVARAAADALCARGETVGVVQVRLFRPFPVDELLDVIPPSVRRVAVLDRTKEPGASGEPLYLDVVNAFAHAATGPATGPATAGTRPLPLIIGGRYGLASKEFTPADAAGVFAELGADRPWRSISAGIVDDVTHTSVRPDHDADSDRSRLRAVFYGLGSDGTVGATKANAKLIGDQTEFNTQAYFVYDSKKSGSVTVSHLRVDAAPIEAAYLISTANFVAVHQFGLLDRLDVLRVAAPGACVLLDSPYSPAETWERLDIETQRRLCELGGDVWLIDAHRVARECGLGGRINTVMQAAFLALSGILAPDTAAHALAASITHEYARRGDAVVAANLAAASAAAGALRRLDIAPTPTATRHRRRPVPPNASEFAQRVTAAMLAGDGDLLPVSALPPDGAFPVGTARYEKRAIATELPQWDPSICIDCAKCTLVCPHAAIRLKLTDTPRMPAALASKPFRSREHPGLALTIQVAPDDCTGCGICAEVCPATSKSHRRHKALTMVPFDDVVADARSRWEAFAALDGSAGAALDPATPKGSQAREPYFEFSGACAGCGETPYLKLLTQLFGDHLYVANATGCSSIYGANLPTTPWTASPETGCGPAWANSLFEDNAEFGLGIRLATDRLADAARAGLVAVASRLDADDLVAAVLAGTDGDPVAQRGRVAELDRIVGALAANGDAAAAALVPLTSSLVRASVWIVGGDGWAYDIGAGGLDHVLGSGRDVNVLVLDTEVYSNTGGQASKATPRAAVAKFATGGKRTPKKDLGMEVATYGDVYVAQIALGANDVQAVKAFEEADRWRGPSLVLAYSTCIAHGIDMRTSMQHQRDAVRAGHWPLYRYRPVDTESGLGAEHAEDAHPLQLDCRDPSLPLADLVRNEGRYAMLARRDPERAATLLTAAQSDIDERWRYYRQLAGIERHAPVVPVLDGDAVPVDEEDL